MVKEIVKNSKTPVKTRIIPTKVIDKFAGKITKVEPDIARVVEEERAEREIAMLENRANKMQNQLKNPSGEAERAWIQKPRTKKKIVGEKLRIKKEVAKMDPEEKKIWKEAQFDFREAKRARKAKKIYAAEEDKNNRFSKKRGSRGGIKQRNKRLGASRASKIDQFKK